jgi:hypothetical protein
MTERVMSDEAGVRFGMGGGVLFLLTDVLVVGRLPGEYGVAALLLASTLFAAALNRPYALLLGLAGWAFATGFEVNTLGVLTLAPPDLLRLGVFVVAATATGSLGDTP